MCRAWQPQTSLTASSDPTAHSKRDRWEMNDSTFSKSVPPLSLPRSSSAVTANNSLASVSAVLTMLSWLSNDVLHPKLLLPVVAPSRWMSPDIFVSMPSPSKERDCNIFEAGVWELCDNKCNSLAVAAEEVCVILSIDETVVNPKLQDPGAATGMGAGANMQGQNSLSNMMGNAMDAVNASKGGSQSGNLGNGVSYIIGRGGG